MLESFEILLLHLTLHLGYWWPGDARRQVISSCVHFSDVKWNERHGLSNHRELFYYSWAFPVYTNNTKEFLRESTDGLHTQRTGTVEDLRRSDAHDTSLWYDNLVAIHHRADSSSELPVPHTREPLASEVHSAVFTDWPPACLHKLFPRGHQRGNWRKPRMEYVSNSINIFIRNPFKFSTCMEYFEDFVCVLQMILLIWIKESM